MFTQIHPKTSRSAATGPIGSMVLSTALLALVCSLGAVQALAGGGRATRNPQGSRVANLVKQFESLEEDSKRGTVGPEPSKADIVINETVNFVRNTLREGGKLMGYGYDGSPCTKECAFFVLLQKGGKDPIELLSPSSSSLPPLKQESKAQGLQRTSQPKRTRPASHAGTISPLAQYPTAPKASPVYEPTPPAPHQFKVSLPKRASSKDDYSSDEDE